MLSLTLPGPAGALEALLRAPAHPAGAAVVAHPHPLFGGTMHTKVVHRAAKLLADRLHLCALRFNFRGVGASEGAYDDGRGETDDLVAAVRFARGRHPGGPLVLAGFSFGSLCAARAATVVDADVLLLIGVPLDRWAEEEAEALEGRNVVWVQGERDQFGAGPLALETAARHGFRAAVVPGADHFFTGHLDGFESAALRLLGGAGLGSPGPHA
jgi:alpha/beta superfamily hydrolase